MSVCGKSRSTFPTGISRGLVGAATKWLPISLLGFFLLLPCRPTIAQTFQFLPEIDGYYRISSAIRLDFQAKETREAGDPTQVELGPSVNFFVKPLVSLKNIPIFDPTESK